MRVEHLLAVTAKLLSQLPLPVLAGAAILPPVQKQKPPLTR